MQILTHCLTNLLLQIHNTVFVNKHHLIAIDVKCILLVLYLESAIL